MVARTNNAGAGRCDANDNRSFKSALALALSSSTTSPACSWVVGTQASTLTRTNTPLASARSNTIVNRARSDSTRRITTLTSRRRTPGVRANSLALCSRSNRRVRAALLAAAESKVVDGTAGSASPRSRSASSAAHVIHGGNPLALSTMGRGTLAGDSARACAHAVASADSSRVAGKESLPRATASPRARRSKKASSTSTFTLSALRVLMTALAHVRSQRHDARRLLAPESQELEPGRWPTSAP